ncbi:10622_t:CDS:2 [Gigaspora margarita]|uniref:10622_t:CDS:1 n=1 Tax=Gigaspora margarita TaxID=4874 RepID=A0ABN7V553_GIGMA|nr:10622_t:CDS:2 [Gigaspora margarita]
MLNNSNNLNTGDLIESDHSEVITKLDKNLITEQELKQQLSASIPISIAPDQTLEDQLRDQDSSLVTAQNIICMFKKAIKFGQEAILYWCYFIEKYDKRIDEFVANGVKKKTATSMIIAEVSTIITPSIQSSNSIDKISEEVKSSPETEVNIPTESYVSPKNNPKINSPKLYPLKKMLSKEKRKEVINKLTMYFTDSPKVDLYFSVDKEGEHQVDTYWVFGSHCPLCRENHMSLKGIPFDEVLEAYPENSKLIQELKTQSFTLPIPWNNALKFPNKSITVEA